MLDKRQRDQLVTVPYFDGLLAGEPDALVESFAGEPELHDPVRGRIKGARAFRAFVVRSSAWLGQRNVSVEDVEHVVLDGAASRRWSCTSTVRRGRVELPFAIVADRASDGRLDELRIYYSGRPLTGRHANRPPLLQPDPGLRVSDVVADYERALAAGDVDAIVAAFEPDGYAREPAGGQYVHSGPDGLRAFYERLFSNGGGIPLETAPSSTTGGRARWSTTSCGGAGRSCRRRPGSPSTSGARAASSPRPASTTTRLDRRLG